MKSEGAFVLFTLCDRCEEYLCNVIAAFIIQSPRLFLANKKYLVWHICFVSTLLGLRSLFRMCIWRKGINKHLA